MFTVYNGRRTESIENSDLRITVLRSGGHIAEILDKRTGVNPLWTPPWSSIDPTDYDPATHWIYGAGSDAKLLSGIAGHNLCLDLFGGPSTEEASAGMTVHGEAPVVDYKIGDYDIGTCASELVIHADLPFAQMRFKRTITLFDHAARIRETVENRCAFDRPIGWTQHVTLGPPFLERGITQFRASATRSKVFEGRFGAADYLQPGAEFDWPLAPLADPTNKNHVDLTVFNHASQSSAYTAHLMDPQKENAFFIAFSPSHELAIAYIWKRLNFPWMGIWEENHSRTHSPWNRQTLARGMEFGMSPIPESRREMVERGWLFGAPTFGWLRAHERIEVEYWAMTIQVPRIPESIEWPA